MMNKLLNSVRSLNNKDDLIKKSIINQLSNCIKELQYNGIENKTSTAVDSTEAANQLCIIIEALFLHGLKNSLTHRFRRVLADFDERPEPNFWAPLLVISHRQIIDQIISLTQITTEVGQCRSWVRLALNDCLLSSYLIIMRQDTSALKNFYKIGAFIRDLELLDVAQRLIEGFETLKCVTLPCNSSLLNTWPLPSLYMAGIWAPTLKTCPVAPCDDVAQSLENLKVNQISENMSDTCSLSSAMSITSQSSGLRQMVAFNEDEVLKIILAKNNGENSSTSNVQTCDDQKSFSDISEAEMRSSESEVPSYPVGNSINRGTGWSFDENQEMEKPVAASSTGPPETPKTMENSFHALIESYNMFYGDYIRTPNLRDVWQKIDESHPEWSPSVTNNNGEENEDSKNVMMATNDIGSLTSKVGNICREKGMDKQNYECSTCKHQLEIMHKIKIQYKFGCVYCNISIFSVCAFTAEYYCDNCMSDEYISIPARIIHNWDFKQYPVSRECFDYVNNVKDQPIIDFKILNPYIYSAVEDMAELQILRNQLNYLRAYLYTCREPIIEELKKQLWPREYMYEHIHLYSISDLSEVSNGVLAQCLRKVVAFGKEHVNTCWLCSQKGFVCEVCNKSKALFPFDVENIYQCNTCNAVYHKSCLNSNKPCPKCKRKKERDSSFIDDIVQ